MRKLFLSYFLLPCFAVLASCQLLKKKDDGDAAADGAAAAAVDGAAVPEAAAVVEPPDTGPAPPVVPAAKNAAQVGRFPAETPVADDDLKLANMAVAMTTPRGGQQVAVLKAGSDVVKMAEYQNCILVSFADPKDASSTLMGWIGKEAFVHWAVRDAGAKVVVDAGPPPASKCAAGQEQVVLAANLPPSCRKKCNADGDCKGALAGSCVVAAKTTGAATKVCANE
jgi:hypothetical protein